MSACGTGVDEREIPEKHYLWLAISYIVGSALLRKKEAATVSRAGVTVIASVIATALASPGAGAHDGVETAATHAAEDAVTHTATQERALDDQTRAVTASDARRAAAAVAGAPQDVGKGVR